MKSLLLEGKKTISNDYIKNFNLAEKCFLHQRVYDPETETLVRLTHLDQCDWDEESDAYVGR